VEAPLTILFVEDESDLRTLVMSMLLAHGFRVFVAADGIDALHILHRHHVDLLFTDIVMPGIDGVQLLKHARLVRPDLKVLFTTGYVQRATEREATRYGRVLFKPLRHSEILQEVEALVGAPG
jgi:two-component system cell cycle sensor histidine kinase/response regulator CckA